MIRWREAKLHEEKNNVAILIDSVSGREINQGVSAESLLRDAAAEIEERANSRLKISQWRTEKKEQEEQALVIDVNTKLASFFMKLNLLSSSLFPLTSISVKEKWQSRQ